MKYLKFKQADGVPIGHIKGAPAEKPFIIRFENGNMTGILLSGESKEDQNRFFIYNAVYLCAILHGDRLEKASVDDVVSVYHETSYNEEEYQDPVFFRLMDIKKCGMLKVRDFVKYSEKCYCMTLHDGKRKFVPTFYIGDFCEYPNGYECWISTSYLDKNEIHYNRSKTQWYDENGFRMQPIEKAWKTTPKDVDPVDSNDIEELRS